MAHHIDWKKLVREHTKPWKDHLMARKCQYCGSHRPGMQPLRLDGKRGFWHLECFEKARLEARDRIREERKILSGSWDDLKCWPDKAAWIRRARKLEK